jgi:hypothetical protein
MIISASRRTDIPSFYNTMFLDILKQGHITIPSKQPGITPLTIKFNPDEIDCIVFWTKYSYPFGQSLDMLDKLGFMYYFQYTITPYGKNLECNVPDKNLIIEDFQYLSGRLGKERIIWRYDPIIIDDYWSMDRHFNTFYKMMESLHNYTEKCVISFVDIYYHMRVKNTFNAYKLSNDDMKRMCTTFANIGDIFNIKIGTCCENILENDPRIIRNACVDAELISRLKEHDIGGSKDMHQRTHCNCTKSVDIGVYNTCNHECIYCYANNRKCV